MTGEFFPRWMESLDHGFGVKDREIELLVDNCPAQPTIEGPINIYVVFLPPNGTSVLHSMDQEVIRPIIEREFLGS